MAIARLLRSIVVNNSQKSMFGDRRFILAIVLLNLLVSSCSNRKLNQCEQIFHLVREVNNRSKKVSYVDIENSREMKDWLEVADTMKEAASQIKALHVDDELIKHQEQLAKIYGMYSQATYDAVTARENKNLEALKVARINAQKASKIQQDLIKNINAYCLGIS